MQKIQGDRIYDSREKRKLPIGIQSFVNLRQDGYVYVDKTEYVYKLAHEGKPYFLSRPRRFGKSLFLSTLRAYWEGKKELFEGLKIIELEGDNPDAWQPYPVFYFDFNRDNYIREMALEDVLEEHLREWERQFGNVESKVSLYLQFVFITGVTKFSKVSIFSDLNQLRDISMLEDFVGICGINESELKDVFAPEIKAMAVRNHIDDQECLTELKQMYDGYHFCEDSKGIYNPFSLLNALASKKFEAYWFATGTPTFLVEKLKHENFDIKRFTDDSIEADEDSLKDYSTDNPDPIPLLYQSGYLTIHDYDRQFRSYILGYPNNEVKYAFLKSLAPAYLYGLENPSPLDIRAFGRDILRADLDSLRDRFPALYATFPM